MPNFSHRPDVRRSRLRWLCLLLLIAPARHQAEQLSVKSYTTADGLARDNVIRIVEDSRGYLWFCTAEGLSRFDGYEFKNYTTDDGLPHRRVNDLLETRAGVYWIATHDGLARFNPGGGAGGTPQRASLFTVYKVSDYLATDYVTCLFEDHAGAVWLGTGAGLYRLDENDEQTPLRFVEVDRAASELDRNAPLPISGITEDGAGALWLATRNGLYRRRPDGRVERFTAADGLLSTDVLKVGKDSGGRVWAGTAAGPCELNADPSPGRNSVARCYTERDGLAGARVSAQLLAPGGRVWVGTPQGVSAKLPAPDGGGHSFRGMGASGGMSNVLCLALDGGGGLWVGTERGAYRIVDEGITTYREAEGLTYPHLVSIFENSSGELYAVGGAGATGGALLYRFDGDHFTGVRPNARGALAEGNWGVNQVSFQDHLGDWWLATGEGLYRYAGPARLEQLASARPSRIYAARDGLSGDSIFHLYEDRRGDIWIATNGEPPWLARWDRAADKIQTYPLEERYKAFGGPTAFLEDRDGALWIGYYHGSVTRYRDGRFERFTPDDGLPAGQIGAFHQDGKGRLWIATAESGIVRVDDPRAARPQFTRLSTRDGLASNTIYAVAEDGAGRLYLAGGRGVDRLEPETGRVKHYTTADGMADNNVRVAFTDSRGALWFGTGAGVSRLQPEAENKSNAPPILISRLQVGEDAYPISELGANTVAPLELAPERNRLQVDFISLSHAPGENLQYQYKLEGLDAAWSAPSSKRSVTFASLAPGSYHFLVRAVNGDGVASARPASVVFTVLPPVWRRWWFIGLAALFVAITILMIERYRAARTRELNAALTQSRELAETLTGQRAELHRANRALSVEYDVTRILAESASSADATPEVLRAICENLGWEIGAVWDVDQQSSLLRCASVWQRPTCAASEFIAMTREQTFAPGEGLPGQVWATAEPAWVADIAQEKNFPRFEIAAREGVRSGFGFPLSSGSEVIGVIEFFKHEPGAADEELLEMMKPVGAQIGQLLVRKRSEEALRESETRFRTLAETASDAIITIDEQSTIIYVNLAVEKIFGYAAAELIGSDLTLLMPEYLRRVHDAGLARYVETGRKHIAWAAVELPGLRKGGEEIPLELSFGEFTKNGRRFFTGIARDITERKHAEEALQRTREERLVELEKVRKRIAGDLHDDIGSSLTQISLLSEVVRQRLDRHDSPITQPLSMIATSSRELVDAMSDIVWAINPQKDHLSDLVQRMRSLASEVFTVAGIDFRFDAPETDADVRLGANLRREIFLIFKESINNVIKHSGGTSAELEFRVAASDLLLRVSDNGAGFDQGVESEGHGLLSMRERSREMGGTLEMISVAGKGTTVSLRVPLAEHG